MHHIFCFLYIVHLCISFLTGVRVFDFLGHEKKSVSKPVTWSCVTERCPLLYHSLSNLHQALSGSVCITHICYHILSREDIVTNEPV